MDSWFRRWGGLFQRPHLQKSQHEASLAGTAHVCGCPISVESRCSGRPCPFLRVRKVYVNQRHDNHREPLARYYVGRFADRRDVIVPFFQEHQLRTSKSENFEKFVTVLRLMEERKHLTVSGLIEIAEIAETMNRRKPSEFLRILRDHTPTNSSSHRELKIWSGPYGDIGRPAETTGPPIKRSRLIGSNKSKRNSLSGKFRPARMA